MSKPLESELESEKEYDSIMSCGRISNVRRKREELLERVRAAGADSAPGDLLLLGFCEEYLGDLESAAGRYRDAASGADAGGDSITAAAALLHLGILLGVMTGGEYEQAVDDITRALAVFRERGLLRCGFRAMSELALLNWLRKDIGAAETLLAEVLRDPLIEGHPRERARACHYGGIMASTRNQRERAVELFDEARELFEAEGDEVGLSRVLDSMGNLAAHEGDFNDAFQYFKLSIRYKKRFRDRRGLAISYGSLGRLHLHMGEYSKAIQFFKEDLKLCRALKDMRGVGITLNNLGELHRLQGDADKARECFQDAMDLTVGMSSVRVFASLGLAMVFISGGDPDRAQVMVEETFGDCDPLLQDMYLPRFQHARGLIAYHRGDPEGAARLLHEARDLFTARKDYSIACQALQDLYRLHRDAGEKEDQIQCLREIWRLAERIKASGRMFEARSLLEGIDVIEFLKALVSQYLPSPAVNMIFSTADPSRAGERREITVLFSDLRGFTSLSERSEPEEVVEMLGDYFSRMGEVIDKNRGLIDKYIGDAIMALFGALETDEDHAFQAVLSAAGMHRVLKKINDTYHLTGKAALGMGIGINTGIAVVGALGYGGRYQYTAIGDSVNLSSRIESLTKLFGVKVLVSDQTRGKLDERVKVRELDRVRVKGVSRPVKVFEVLSAGDIVLNPLDDSLLLEYEQALKLYQAGDWKGAEIHLVNVLEEKPDDGPAKSLLARALAPLPENWDGVSKL